MPTLLVDHNQQCPALSPFATCGYRQHFRNGFLMINILSNFDKKARAKSFVASIVSNVVIERIWLNTTGLDYGKRRN
jgi:hypothetical protein